MTATSRRRCRCHADAVSSATTRKREEAARTNQPGAVGGQRGTKWKNKSWRILLMSAVAMVTAAVLREGGGEERGGGGGGNYINTEKTREAVVMAAWGGTA